MTDELLCELLDAPDPDAFAREHRITARSLPEYLQQLLDDKGVERADVIRKSNLNSTYGYYIFTGQRKPTRNKVLQLAFGMHCTLQEANRMLQAAGCNELYCKARRDAIIIFCLTHEHTLLRANEELYRFGEETIC